MQIPGEREREKKKRAHYLPLTTIFLYHFASRMELNVAIRQRINTIFIFIYAIRRFIIVFARSYRVNVK